MVYYYSDDLMEKWSSFTPALTPTTLNAFRVLGIYPVEPTDALLQETLQIQWGSDLSGAELERAQAAVREHFTGLYLFEVLIDPSDADVDWGSITQPVEHQPQSNWQVPYDAQLVDPAAGRWVFFMHFIDPEQPLQTPVGPVRLPPPSTRPPHLSWIEYEAP